MAMEHIHIHSGLGGVVMLDLDLNMYFTVLRMGSLAMFSEQILQVQVEFLGALSIFQHEILVYLVLGVGLLLQGSENCEERERTPLWSPTS